MAILPQIDNSISNTLQTTQTQIPSKTYKLNLDVVTTYEKDGSLKTVNTDRIEGYVDKLEATKQAIYHILMTERYAYLIYDDNYGVELEQYIGADLEYIETTLEDTLREALTHDLRINDVKINSINKVETDKVAVNFTAYTIYGDLVLEVNINV
jgi:hypothetical protein